MFAVLTYRRDWDETEFFATGEAEISEVMAYTRGLGLNAETGRALDFGCGVGRLTRALGTHFEEVVGVDISAPMVDRARALNCDYASCRFVVNTRPDLEGFDSESFDFVYSNITLQHMPWSAAQGYLKEFVRVIKPHGAVVFQLPTQVKDEYRKPAPLALLGRMRSALGVTLRLGRRHMEMHCTPIDRVERAVETSGGVLRDAKPDEREGRRWEGYRYTVVKAGSVAGLSDLIRPLPGPPVQPS